MALRGFPDLPPVWALGVVAVQGVLAAAVPLAPLGTPGVGLLFVLAGLGLILWSAWWFLRKRTSIEPGEVPRALIVEGPYRLNRNPIYTGMTVGLVGTGLLFGAVSSVAAAAVFPWIVTRRFVVPEEAALRAAFGQEAEAYFKTSRRW